MYILRIFLVTLQLLLVMEGDTIFETLEFYFTLS
jgi:hypothetical protein